MACKNVCKLCDRLIISTAVNFYEATTTTPAILRVTLPAGSYANGEKYCIVIAQAIPANTTINANVVFNVGDSTVTYPLVNKCCKQVTACGIRTRTKYSTTVVTTATGGSFRMLGDPACQPNNDLAAIGG